MTMKLPSRAAALSKALSASAGSGRQVGEKIVADPRDMGRLGQAGLAQILGGPVNMAALRAYYYDIQRFDFPLTEDEFSSEFSRSRCVFTCNGSPSCGQQTNAACGAGVNEPFVILGVGIVLVGEFQGFSLYGGVVPDPTETTSTQPVVRGLLDTCDTYCGAVLPGGQGGSDATVMSATASWGIPGWNFMSKFIQAFRLQVNVSRRFTVVDESLAEVGMVMQAQEFQGASDSETGTLPYIRALNDVLHDKGLGIQFLPANEGVTPGGTSVCLPPPLAPHTVGAPVVPGLSNKMFCLTNPILMLPGMRWDVCFINVEDASCFEALHDASVITCGAPSRRYETGLPTVNGASCGTSCYVPAGSLSLGVVFYGYSLQPEACAAYVQGRAGVIAGTPQHAMLAGEGRNYLDTLLKHDVPAGQFKMLAGHPGFDPNKGVLAGLLGNVPKS